MAQRLIKFQGRAPLGMTLEGTMPSWLPKLLDPARQAAKTMLALKEPVQGSFGPQFDREYNAIAYTDTREREAIANALKPKPRVTQELWDAINAGHQWKLPYDDPTLPQFHVADGVPESIVNDYKDGMRFVAEKYGGLGRETIEHLKDVYITMGDGSGSYRFDRGRLRLRPATPEQQALDGLSPMDHMFLLFHELTHSRDRFVKPQLFVNYPKRNELGYMPPRYWGHPAENSANAGGQADLLDFAGQRTGQGTLPDNFIKPIADLSARDWGLQARRRIFPKHHPWLKHIPFERLAGSGDVFFEDSPEQLALFEALR